jgi:hypothetical protein
MANAAASDPAAIKDFYDKHPELFAQRKVYRLQEVALQVRGEELDKLKQALPPMKSLQEVIAYAKANNLRATTNASVRAAEQLPMEFAKRIAGLKDGEVVAVPGPNGVAVIQIVASQQQPLDEAKAKPFIEQFIQNKSRMELAQAELKSLRAAAKLEYVGDFAKPAEEAAAPAPEANGGMGSSLEQQAGQQPVPATGGGADDDALQKGLSGLKK